MTRYRLDLTPSGRLGGTATAPVLDAAQDAVVRHAGGPLLVLAGPGTGKTTTLVEAIVDRVQRRGLAPDQILALTFSRKAAEQLRDKVTARLGRTMSSSLASTFHSFAFSLVRQWSDAEAYTAPLRLLSAAEQDVVVQTLLQPEPESVPWPEALAQARTTRGFAREVTSLLARAREKGLAPADLVALGKQEGRPAWVSAGEFLEQYLTVLDSQSALDYADLVVRAVALTQRPEVRQGLRERFAFVVVDEYQDTDPSQVALLRALAGDGRDLLVVGDPDQSIYGFRGAEVRGILDFPSAFPDSAGRPAPVVALARTRRFGPRLLEASRRIATALPVAGSIPLEAFDAFRHPDAVATDGAEDRVDVLTFDTERAETEHLADLLRRAHLEDGVPWSRMAVLVRSGRTSIPGLRRSLVAAGVPVEVAADDTPIVREPAVMPLLEALAAAVHRGVEDPADPDFIDPARAESLLLSPLGGLDAAELRVVGRELRRRDRERAAAEGRAPAPSRNLVRAALMDPSLLDGLEGRPAAKARRLAALLARAHEALADRATAEQVLWLLWSGTAWGERLRLAAVAGGPAGQRAHRDLDALCALFETAARAEEQRAHTSVANFLSTLVAQQIPSDTLAERGVRGQAVRLLTAHRSKGLEWDLVVVAHVQDEGWPDLRRRSTLLRADEVGPGEVLPPLTIRALLAEERRLFYVACTRARRRLVVTAVASADDDGEQPSRFLDELGVPRRHVVGRPRRPLSLPGLIAELRRTAGDESCSPALRAAAAARLARLASEQDAAGRALAPQADPGSWWGLRARTHADVPLRPTEEPLTLSASTVEALLTCPARWFLEKEAGGAERATAAQGFGLLVHAIAERVATEELSPDEDLMPYVDQVWDQLTFRTPWSSARERREVEAALRRFVSWHRDPAARELLATEHELRAEVALPDGETVRLYGFADRIERDADGRVWVVDLKTGKYPPQEAALVEHPQLGLYQHAIRHGAVDALLGEEGEAPEPGGAELVHLRLETRGKVKVQRQAPQEPGTDGRRPVELQLLRAVEVMRGEALEARSGDHCERCTFTAICPVKGGGNVLS